MLGLAGIIAILVVLGLSLFLTRVATTALVLTGLSTESARFQARSAFTGTGFTTREAENVVGHPVRRRIIMLLMLFRSAGVITIVISIILSFGGGAAEGGRLTRLFWLAGGVAVLGIISRSRLIDRALTRPITWALKRFTDLDTRDYVGLLHLSGEYTIMEVTLREEDWLEGKRLGECRLTEEGVIVLGVYRADGSYIGVPRSDTRFYPGDNLVLYGRAGALKELDRRRRGAEGEESHRKAVRDQEAARDAQKQQEDEYERKCRKDREQCRE
jgi:hypothetical protein